MRALCGESVNDVINDRGRVGIGVTGAGLLQGGLGLVPLLGPAVSLGPFLNLFLRLDTAGADNSRT